MIRKRLGDIVNFKRGYDLPSYKRKDGKYPVISSSGVTGCHSEFKAEGEGIITGRYGTLGEVYYVTGKYWPHNTALYVTDFKGNYPKYVYFLLKQLGNLKTSDKSTVPGVNRNDLHEIMVPYIEPNLQKPIADCLFILEEKIKLNDQINASIELIAKTLYEYWFVQFDFPDKNGKPYRSSGGEMNYCATLDREIPKGWDVLPARKVLKLQRGVSYTSEEISFGHGIPMINLGSIGIDKSYRHDKLKFYAGKLSKDRATFPGDLLIACTDLTRNADIIGCPIVVPTILKASTYSMDLAKIILTSEQVLPMYIYMVLRTDWYHRYIKRFASGTNVLHLDTEGIMRYHVEIPPLQLQKRYQIIAENIQQKVNQGNIEIQMLVELRDWLLPILMNSQVKVNTKAAADLTVTSIFEQSETALIVAVE